MNRLIILEDNLEFSRNLLNYIILQNRKIQLFSMAIDGEELVKNIDSLTENDILLLDLGLPKINGLEIIDKLKSKQDHRPYIIVMSGNLDLMEKLVNYRPYIYASIQKPFAFNRIVEILDKIIYESEQNNYEKLIKQELRKFEINVITVGYTYIIDAIAMSLSDESLLRDMKNTLYKCISIKHNNASTANIKWTIEKSIKSIARYTDSRVLNSYFYLETSEKLTPKLFISTVVEKLKEQIEEESKRKVKIY